MLLSPNFSQCTYVDYVLSLSNLSYQYNAHYMTSLRAEQGHSDDNAIEHDYDEGDNDEVAAVLAMMIMMIQTITTTTHPGKFCSNSSNRLITGAICFFDILLALPEIHRLKMSNAVAMS